MDSLASKMQHFLDCTKKYPFSSIVVSFGTAYFTYYLLYAVKKPVVACNPRLAAFLHKRCPLLGEKFWPTFWCFEARMQTIMRSLLKSFPAVPYKKEFLDLPDGGHVALDWVQNAEKNKFPSTTRPTVLILPGLTGSSDESYARHLVLKTSTLGYRAVVFNNRGNGGADLKTARTYNATNTDDLESVIHHIKELYPEAPLIAIGVSLGGIILANYLAKADTKAGVVAAMTVSVPYDMFESTRHLESPPNVILFNRLLGGNLVNNLRRYEQFYKDKIDLNYVYQALTIRDFDSRFTAPQFGYPSYVEYYADACIHRKLQDIKVPLLCLNAADDHFSPYSGIPLEEARKSDNVAIVMTSRGGHIGFLEGLLPRQEGYMDRVFGQYIQAIFSHLDELHQPVECNGNATTN